MIDRRVLRVQIVERVEKLVEPTDDVIDRERRLKLLEHVAKLFAFNKFHDKELPVLVRKVITDVRDDLVLDLRQKLGLAFERRLDQFLLLRAGSFDRIDHDLLDRAGRVENVVVGLINGTHSTVPKLAHDPVAAVQHFIYKKHLKLSPFRS